MFIHDAVLEALTCGNTEIVVHDLRVGMNKLAAQSKGTTGYAKQFQVRHNGLLLQNLIRRPARLTCADPRKNDSGKYCSPSARGIVWAIYSVSPSSFSQIVLQCSSHVANYYVNEDHKSYVPLISQLTRIPCERHMQTSKEGEGWARGRRRGFSWEVRAPEGGLRRGGYQLLCFRVG